MSGDVALIGFRMFQVRIFRENLFAESFQCSLGPDRCFLQLRATQYFHHVDRTVFVLAAKLFGEVEGLQEQAHSYIMPPV